MLKKRFLTALWGIPLIVAIVWFGGLGNMWLFTACIAVWALIALLEFYRLAKPLKISPVYIFGILWTLAFIVLRHPSLTDKIPAGLPLIPTFVTGGIVISLFTLLARKEKFNAIPAWAWTWAGILYVGWLLGYAVALYGFEDGRSWVFYALFCTFGSDTTAFFIGRSLGKHKMSPTVSPHKTWEGSIGGLLGAVVISLLFLLPHPVSLAAHLKVWQAVVLGLLVSIFGQAGDLSESLMKRNVGVKDAGNLLPGHGGILDRMDSIVFALVIVYFWVTFFS
jgi:phosphatidate cytidylyltransferase